MSIINLLKNLCIKFISYGFYNKTGRNEPCPCGSDKKCCGK